jgi:uncharacterized surface protein with fasciclin (FAS1) repeats
MKMINVNTKYTAAMKKNNIKYLGIAGLLLINLLFFNRCNKIEYDERTNYQLLIGEYLAEKSSEFSTFVEVLEKSNSLSFLNAYGTYTCFAPTNEAWEAYFQKTKPLAQHSPEELKELVRYHVIIDTINSQQFVDGKLPTPSMYGQYLTTQVYNESGNAVTKVNKYSVIKNIDLRMLNGIVHSVQSVLEPVKLTVAQSIEANPDFSIFTEALKETKLYDTLNKISATENPDPRWFTIFVIPNIAYNLDGINSYEDLKSRYTKGSDVSVPSDSLNLYMAYHILDNSLKYISDLVIDRAHATKAPLEVLTIKAKGDSVLVNEDEFAGMIEKGYPIDREFSNNTSANGVFHVMANTGNRSGNFGIKIRKPMAIYWEVTDQPEIRKMPGVFRKIGSTSLWNGNLANVSWYGNNSISYVVGDAYPYYVFNDYFNINLRPEVVKWIEFTTPIIVKGKYKVWICTRNVWGANNRKAIFFAYFDDVVFPTIINNQITLNREVSDEEYELTGWKWYQYNPKDSLEYNYNYIGADGSGRFAGQLAGTIDVEVTGTHKIKFVGITGTNGCWLDEIHFIPVENNQIWPRVNVLDGSLVYKETLPKP